MTTNQYNSHKLCETKILMKLWSTEFHQNFLFSYVFSICFVKALGINFTKFNRRYERSHNFQGKLKTNLAFIEHFCDNTIFVLINLHLGKLLNFKFKYFQYYLNCGCIKFTFFSSFVFIFFSTHSDFFVIAGRAAENRAFFVFTRFLPIILVEGSNTQFHVDLYD